MNRTFHRITKSVIQSADESLPQSSEKPQKTAQGAQILHCSGGGEKKRHKRKGTQAKTKEKRKTKVLLVALLLLAGFGYVREESFDVKEVHSSTTFYSIERIVWYFCVF